VGKPSTPTPQGKFAIINRVPNPTWYGPSVTVAPGKNNPLGSRWMGLSVKGYGIHGTNVPSSIGKAASHGCVRMRKQDLEELFEMVTVGTTVELQGEPSELLTGILSEAVSE
jgi:lipoprotein-anchoring transpeptidase ErfK/SrfK